MAQPRNFVVSTVGTSSLTNRAPADLAPALRNHANAKQPIDIPTEVRSALNAWIERRGVDLAGADLKRAALLSAELNSLLAFYDHRPPCPSDAHLLICTDTWLGECAARGLEAWLRQHGCAVEVLRQKDLQTGDLRSFQLALSELTRWLGDCCPGRRVARYHVVFNLTGGFKSVQGFLQTLGMFYADEVVYIFEGSDQLLRIPRLPVAMSLQPAVREHLRTFRRLGAGLTVQPADTVGVPETFLLRIDDEVALSPWGELVWDQNRQTLYGQQLWPSPSERIRYGPGFEASVKGLPPDRLAKVNEQIDKLMAYLEGGRQVALKSLDYKALEGNPRPPATHEFDAWHDKDARRVFCRQQGNVVELLKLDKKLQ